jgi:hypothetical protein
LDLSNENVVQVSWGTKGSDKVDALPSVSSKKDADNAVVEDKTQVQADVDAAFTDTVKRALKKDVKAEVPEKPTPDDQNKTFRTRLVAVWMLSNAGLAIAIENVNGLPQNEAADEVRLQKKQSTYFAIILYSTFVLALIRFLGVRGLNSLSFRRAYVLTLGFFFSRSACSISSSATCSAASAGLDYADLWTGLRFTLAAFCVLFRSHMDLQHFFPSHSVHHLLIRT